MNDKFDSPRCRAVAARELSERLAKPGQRQAFTRLELLVVVSVVVLLAGVLLPVHPCARASARSAACVNNLRQLGSAVGSYVSHAHEYPTASEWSRPAITGSGGPLLPHLPQGYATFICPERQRSITPDSPNLILALFSYGYNAAGTARDAMDVQLGLGRYTTKRIADSRIKVPSEMIEAGDSGLGMLSDTWLSPSALGPGEVVIEEQTQWPTARHRGRANILFCDNHVSSAGQKKWLQKTDEARRQWNNDNQPHRETW